jgi:predicted lipid-binding transport protein (Tim44 family)
LNKRFNLPVPSGYLKRMGEGHFLDIILLAMVAGFILLRLRSVLGRRTGHEPNPGDGVNEPKGEDDNVVPLPDQSSREAAIEKRKEGAKLWADDSPVAGGLTQIKIADPKFDVDDFVAGSRAAYEMVVAAFAASDHDTLRNLLADDVYESFAAAIDDREEANQTLEQTIVAIESADLAQAQLNGRDAEVTMKFVTDMITTLKDENGEPLAGQSTSPRRITDIWTFGRDTGASDPNWRLIETSSEN